MKEKIIEIIRNACALEENDITSQTKLEDLSLDSLSFIEIIVRIEEEFQITFEDRELNFYDWEEVGELVRLVEERICR